MSEDHVVTLSDTFTVSGHAVGAGWKRTISMFIRQCISFELNCVYGMVCIHVCVCCDVDHCQSSVLCHCVCVCADRTLEHAKLLCWCSTWTYTMSLCWRREASMEQSTWSCFRHSGGSASTVHCHGGGGIPIHTYTRYPLAWLCCCG